MLSRRQNHRLVGSVSGAQRGGGRNDPVMMRRKLVMALGAAALTVPFGAVAQQPGKVWRIGFLSPRIIVAQGGAALVARKATAAIPVVFGYSGDPVEAGLVESLARPQRNMTGISYMSLELVGKRIELLKQAIPAVRRIAVIANANHAGDSAERKSSQAAATTLGLTLEYYEVSNAAQLGDALTAIEKNRSDAVMMFPVQNIINNRERIAAWSIKNRLPTMSGWAQFADGGNLMSYGPNLREASGRLAYFVDRILKGAKPEDLPVELPTKVEFVINMKTARALGVRMPRAAAAAGRQSD